LQQLFRTDEGARARTPVPAHEQPLPVRLRPRSLDEVVGQGHVLAEGTALRRAIEEGRPHSTVLYGPPGTGKTTIARLLATYADAAFEEASAVEAGRAEVREVLRRAEERRRAGRGTIFFLDEIHRFTKAQQDALLPAVEEGLVTLVGATTENPYFEINSALLSRTQVYELRALAGADVRALLERALSDPERGIGEPPPVSERALDFLAARSGGDARAALAALELACATVASRAAAGEGAEPEVALADAEDAMQRKAVLYDKGGDRHYDTISAWIKATRGSDPDASLLYLAMMLEGGEDPRFIARRMIILASEDIGNADPRALEIAVAAAHAVEHVGLPECTHNLAQAAVYLSLAPKSNASYRALATARAWVREHGAPDIPGHLRSAGHPGERELGHGVGYDYPHDRPDAFSEQELMPPQAAGERFLEPSDRGEERALGERLAELRRCREGRSGPAPAATGRPPGDDAPRPTPGPPPRPGSDRADG
jgi:putative ATPase